MKILAFSASLRKDSLNKKLLNIAVGIAKAKGATVDVIDLNGFLLPSYDGDLETSGQWPSNLTELKIQLETHDALMIATPEYNNSMPGHFKNTFDWVSRLRPMPWAKKKVFMMSASPGLVGGNRSLWALRVPFEVAGSYVSPEMFSLASADQAFNDKNELKDAKLLERLTKNISSYLEFAKRLDGI